MLRKRSTRLLIVALAAVMLLVTAPARAAEVSAVQSGTTTISGTTSATATITSVDLTKSFLVFGVTNTQNTTSDTLVSGEMTNATTLTFKRVGMSGSCTVHWYVAEFSSGVSVQRGVATVSSTTTNVTVTSVDLTKSFPLVSARQEGSKHGSDDAVRAKLSSATNLQVLHETVGISPNYAPWQVVEFDGATVQSGDVTFGTSDSSRTATVTSVDTSTSWLIFSQTQADGTQTNIGQKLLRGRVTNPTTLTFDRSSTGVALEVTWYLVEFTDGTTVQHNTRNFGTVDTQKDVTITSVNTSESIATTGAWGRSGRSNYTSDDVPGVGWFTADLTSATNLRLNRGTASSSTADVGWFVVDFYKCAGAAIALADHDAGQSGDTFSGQGEETDAELFAFKLDPGGGSTTITEVQFSLSSITGLVDGDWDDVEIVVDDNGNGHIGGSETTVVGGAGVVNQAAGTITFSTSFAVSAATHYVLRADFASLSSGDGDTVTIGLSSSGFTAGSDCVSGSTSSVVHKEVYVPCYVESYQVWQATSSDTWQTKSLAGAPFNVPANAVVEIAVRNSNTGNQRWGGVRAVGSSNDRRFQLVEAESSGWETVTMHVKTDASSQIQHYSDNTSDVRFILLGYWNCGTYVEAWQAFSPTATSTWHDRNLSIHGVAASQVAEIVLTNLDTSYEREAGVRTNGSSLSRIIDLVKAQSGGVSTATMHVAADATASATIELWAQDTSDVDYTLVGYWSSPPLKTYQETFTDVGTPAADLTWEDKSLSGSGVPPDAVAEFSLVNAYTSAQNNIGVRPDGSTLARVLDVQEAEDGGHTEGRMHVNAGSAATIEFYHEDVSESNFFYLTGYWTDGPVLTLANHGTGQEHDAFADAGSVTNAELYAFTLTPSYGTIAVDEVTFSIQAIAGLVNGDFGGVEMIVDTNGDGTIGGGETTAVGGTGTVSTSAGTITFTSNFNVSAATSYVLRADFSSLADGDSMIASLQTGDITLVDDGLVGSCSPVMHTEGTYGGGDVLFIVPNEASLSTYDTSKKTLMESMGYRVAPTSASTTQSTFDRRTELYDVVYVSETVGSTSLGTKIADTPIGVVLEEPALYDEFGIASSYGSPTDDEIDVTDNTHYVTRRFATGDTSISSVVQSLTNVGGTVGTGVQVLAEQVGGSVGMTTALDAADTRYGGGGAPGRRVALPWGQSNFDVDDLTDGGTLIMRRALDWAAGPLAYLKFDSTSGGTTPDDRGPNTGTVTGASLVTGQVGKALDFNGASGIVALNGDAQMNMASSSSIAFWFKPDATFTSATATSQVLVGKYLDADNNMVVALVGTDYTQATVSDGSLVIKMENGGLRYKWTTQTSWTADTWYHVVVTFDREESVNNSLFVNAVDLTATTDVAATGTPDPSYTQAFQIGGGDADQLPAAAYFDGLIDDVRIYNRCLDQDDATRIYLGETLPIVSWGEIEPGS